MTEKEERERTTQRENINKANRKIKKKNKKRKEKQDRKKHMYSKGNTKESK